MNIQAIERKKAQLASKNQSLAEQGLLRQLFTSSIHGQTEINLSDDMAFLDNQEAIEIAQEPQTAARPAAPQRFQLGQLMHEQRMSFAEPSFMMPSLVEPHFTEPNLEEENQHGLLSSRSSRNASQGIVMAELMQEEHLSSWINTENHYRIQANQVDNQFVDIRYLAKRSFAVDVASKKVATTPVGGSYVNDNSDFRKRSIERQNEAQRIISRIRIEAEANMFNELKTIVQEQINNEVITDSYHKTNFEKMLDIYESSIKRVQAGTAEHQTLLQLIASTKMKLGEYS